MKEHGASAQAIAFMRFAPVPAAISEVKSYPVAAVVHADMMFADAADRWALIGKSGDVVQLWYGVELHRDPQFRPLRSEASRRNVMGRLDRLAQGVASR